MPVIYPTGIFSYSSEDPNCPASNLLEKDRFKKWRCKEPWEDKAFVVLKFDKLVQFTGIDIGNEKAATVEIQVGRSGNYQGGSGVKWEPLLNASMLMSALDSRNLNNTETVRTFSIKDFDKEVAAEKWDLVKISVSQQFNKHTQYGLSFVKFVAAAEEGEAAVPQKIGVFELKKSIAEDDEDDEYEPRLGALFAKRLAKKNGKAEAEPANTDKGASTSATIRDITSSISGAAKSSNEQAVKDALKKHKVDISISSGSSPSAGAQIGAKNTKGTSKSTSGGSGASSGSSGKSSSRPTLQSQPGPSSSSQRSRKDTSKVKLKPDISKNKKDEDEDADKPRKPFNKLFEDVVFVLSGFINPLRSSLRNRAIEMGAKCKPDWDSTCTHLICAFVNTPKFREVRATGHGKIVKKEWIERSYGVKKRFPWRRFCLDRDDKGSESEEEILAEEDDDDEEEETSRTDDESAEPSQSSGASRMNSNKRRGGDDDEEDEEEIISPGKRKRKRIIPVDDSDEEENEEKKQESVYEADTDVDDPPERNNSSKSEANKSHDDDSSDTDFEEPPVPQKRVVDGFFEGSVFFFPPSEGGGDAAASSSEKDEIEQIVSRRKGRVLKKFTDKVEYLLTPHRKWKEEFAEALVDNPRVNIVNMEWVRQCEKVNQKISCEEFIVTPDS